MKNHCLSSYKDGQPFASFTKKQEEIGYGGMGKNYNRYLRNTKKILRGYYEQFYGTKVGKLKKTRTNS